MKDQYTINIAKVPGKGTDKLAVVSGQQGDVPPHDHSFFELVYVTGGTVVHTLNGRTETLVAGDYFIVDFGSIHSYAHSQDFTLINCLFLPEMIDDTLIGCRSFEQLIRICLIRYSKQYHGQTTVNRTFHDDNGRIHHLLLTLQEECQNKLTGYTEIFRCKILEILILTMRRIIQREKMEALAKVKSTAVLELIQFLNLHYQEKSLLSKFCRESHYSIQYMSRRFKQETGIAVSEYLQNIRIEKSCALLAGSNLPVQEIAREVGYEDVKYYHKVFRKKLKMSPGEYRKI